MGAKWEATSMELSLEMAGLKGFSNGLNWNEEEVIQLKYHVRVTCGSTVKDSGQRPQFVIR